MLVPQIDKKKCTGCGLCVNVCARDGLAIADRVVVFIGSEDCTWCGMCEAVCQTGAINCPFDIILDES